MLVDAAGQEEPLIWLLAPLVAGASVVICANLDRSRLAELTAAEKITRVLARSSVEDGSSVRPHGSL